MKHTHRPNPRFHINHAFVQECLQKRLVIAMLITGSVMVIEIFGSLITSSLALCSDAGHMFTRLFALAISFIAVIIACKEPCHHRTYGFYRAEILAALFNSIFLFIVTAYIFLQGIDRLLHPQPVMGSDMLIFALFGLAANGLTILILG